MNRLRPNPALRALLLAFLTGALAGLALSLPAAAQSQIVRGSFDSDGVKIHYQIEGEGEPVLLIHGYRASGDMNWRASGVVRSLTDGYQVLVIDNRGHGRSDKPELPEAYGRNMVEDQVRLLDHLDIDSAHVIGYSMGGMITLRMLVDHPERIRSAVIAGMGWTRDDEATRERFSRGGAGRGQQKVPLQACYQAFGELGITAEQLAGIETPTMLAIGDDDGLYESSVVPLREVRDDWPLERIEGASHATCSFKKQFHAALRDWLDSQASG